MSDTKIFIAGDQTFTLEWAGIYPSGLENPIASTVGCAQGEGRRYAKATVRHYHPIE